MEEWVGQRWHRYITRKSFREFPQQAVTLQQMRRTLGLVFRGMGGAPGLKLQESVATRHHAHRRLLDRIAGTGERFAFSSIDVESLRLPPQIAIFPSRELNRALYVWLSALAAQETQTPSGSENWFLRNQMAVRRTLTAYPGLRERYARLVEACIALRMDPSVMREDEADQERAVREALRGGSLPRVSESVLLVTPDEGHLVQFPALTSLRSRSVQPVPLWLYPLPPSRTRRRAQNQQSADGSAQEANVGRQRAQQVDAPKEKGGVLMFFRAESLLSWAEFVRVNRQQDDDPQTDAASAVQGMEELQVTQDGERVASRLRMDLELPSREDDDVVLHGDILLEEWDYRTQTMRPDYCRLEVLRPQELPPMPLPHHLRAGARQLKSQFSLLAPIRRKVRAQPDGMEPDLDAWVMARADQCAGVMREDSGLYLAMRQQDRDLACLVLADLSLSTDASVSQDQKVVDVIRDGLMLFAEALAQVGDCYAMYGFSSVRRSAIRYQELKSFTTRFDDSVRARIGAIRPGDYTRLGAAVRFSTRLLEEQPQRQKLLLILSDGKPHDLDLYDGRYGIEDTRKSIAQARESGIKPFCVTIDKEANDYLPHLFGPQGFALLRKPQELPLRLSALYAQLTAH